MRLFFNFLSFRLFFHYPSAFGKEKEITMECLPEASKLIHLSVSMSLWSRSFCHTYICERKAWGSCIICTTFHSQELKVQGVKPRIFWFYSVAAPSSGDWAHSVILDSWKHSVDTKTLLPFTLWVSSDFSLHFTHVGHWQFILLFHVIITLEINGISLSRALGLAHFRRTLFTLK